MYSDWDTKYGVVYKSYCTWARLADVKVALEILKAKNICFEADKKAVSGILTDLGKRAPFDKTLRFLEGDWVFLSNQQIRYSVARILALVCKKQFTALEFEKYHQALSDIESAIDGARPVHTRELFELRHELKWVDGD